MKVCRVNAEMSLLNCAINSSFLAPSSFRNLTPGNPVLCWSLVPREVGKEDFEFSGMTEWALITDPSSWLARSCEQMFFLNRGNQPAFSL